MNHKEGKRKPKRVCVGREMEKRGKECDTLCVGSEAGSQRGTRPAGSPPSQELAETTSGKIEKLPLLQYLHLVRKKKSRKNNNLKKL